MQHTAIGKVRSCKKCMAIALCSLFFFTAAAFGASSKNKITEDSSDGDLLRAVLANSLVDLGKALKEGGDPNRIFGSSAYEWAMCAATLPGNEKVLELLIDNGGNPNLNNSPAAFTKEYPLTCALTKRNRKSYDILVSAGADLTISSCPDCGPGSDDSLILTALYTGNFDVVAELLHLVPVTEADISALKNTVESSHTLRGSPNARYTLEFIDYLAKRGITAVPPYPMD